MGVFTHSRVERPIFIKVNFGLRVCQFILAVVALGFYAASMAWWEDYNEDQTGIAGYHDKNEVR